MLSREYVQRARRVSCPWGQIVPARLTTKLVGGELGVYEDLFMHAYSSAYKLVGRRQKSIRGKQCEGDDLSRRVLMRCYDVGWLMHRTTAFVTGTRIVRDDT
jgi:hypothetical protein